MEDSGVVIGVLSDSEDDEILVTDPIKEASKEPLLEESDGSGSSSGSSSSDDEDAADKRSPTKASVAPPDEAQAAKESNEKNAVAEAAVNEPAWAKLVKDAVEIKPYGGELNPNGILHSANGFLSTFAKVHTELSIPHIAPADPSLQILNALAPKLNELSELRRFQLKNFDAGPGLRLSRGRFAEIRQDTFMNESKVAIKRFVDHADPLTIFKEVHTMIKLQHKRVLKLYGAFYENEVTHLVTEFYQGSLRKNLLNLSKSQKIRFVMQLIEGVDFIHGFNILHCDLRPECLFITAQNNIVIGNFSNSQLLPKDAVFIKTSTNDLLGAPMYNDSASNYGFHSKLTDCFSLGAVIFEIETSQALMEYRPTWTDVPLEEFIQFAEKGRLRKFPPSFEQDSVGSEKKWDLDGVREPLNERVNTFSLMFGKLVCDLVKDIEQRLNTQEVISGYRVDFTRLLKEEKLTRARLDNDPNLGNVQPFVENASRLPPSAVSESLKLVMDMIYHDADYDLTSLTSGAVSKLPKTSFLAIPLDQLKNHMEKFFETYATQSVPTNALEVEDHATRQGNEVINQVLKKSAKSNVKTAAGAISDIPSGKRSLIKKKHGVGTSSVAEHPSSASKSTKKKEVEDHGDTKSNEKSKNPKVKGNSKRPDPNPPILPDPKPSTSRKSSLSLKPRQLTSNVKERNVTLRSPTPAETPPALPSDENVVGKKAGQKGNAKSDGVNGKGGQKRKRSNKRNDEQTPESNDDKTTSKKVKETEGCQGGTTFVPQELRDPPAPPKNLPPGFFKKNGLKPYWRGYFDCTVCGCFYNVDWKLVQEHMAQCFKADQEKKAREKEEKRKKKKKDAENANGKGHNGV